MQNTPSPETKLLPATDRAVINYLGAGYGHIAVALEQVQHYIASNKLLEAQRLVAALELVADTTEDRVNDYLDGAPADLHPKYFDGQAPAAPQLLTYQPVTPTNVI
jgi:hypothetical protein